MTDQELKDLVASLAIQSAETEKRFQKTEKLVADLSIKSAKTEANWDKLSKERSI
jgi:hypothetical protein